VLDLNWFVFNSRPRNEPEKGLSEWDSQNPHMCGLVVRWGLLVVSGRNHSGPSNLTVQTVRSVCGLIGSIGSAAGWRAKLIGLARLTVAAAYAAAAYAAATACHNLLPPSYGKEFLSGEEPVLRLKQRLSFKQW